MMSFCKKSVNSFLGLSTVHTSNLDASHNLEKPLSSKCLPVLTSSGLGLITAADIDAYKTPPNVLESTTFKSPSPPPSPSLPPTPLSFFKKDPGGIGFVDDVGGGVNGLMSCTESLGFESCDERRIDDEIDELCSRTRSSTTKVNWKKFGERREVKKFPPPLSSLNHNGQPSFFLRPVRKDGRLELTEVRIDRPEILRASREDGRLRLHLIRDDEEEEDNDSNIEEPQQQEYELKEKRELEGGQEDGKEGEFQENEEEEPQQQQEEQQQEEEITGEWRFPVTGEGFRRCHELGTGHQHDYHRHHHHHHHHHSNHHHNLHVWSQHCVTTT
ncbi:protein FANTASTIC FOUR 1 [Ricinus communis]|uniref:FAF domain-containing protein n=1 Tax=Ricinus communis TaxID=3988 RepID=B9RF07_RICCO|nr:protein FANTASTIC FOUR 1 [Ricinus communis]EEF49778.1 conserved hypothetical protein [Ricinus communis]|eukprot:XP_002512326.1 protein FANTASTIC FOUR 1 [Ricinus communis]